jgi:16S rRNA (guanine527-N7)-methyltransferase
MRICQLNRSPRPHASLQIDTRTCSRETRRMTLADRKDIILNLGFNASAFANLSAYVELLWASNIELNLFSRQMKLDELIDNHVIDCLLPLAHFPLAQKSVADFGSGGGLPGVIYALHFPQTQFHLFEKSPLKQDFLKKCLALAPNIVVHGSIDAKLGDVELVMARGFKPLDVILDVSRDFYQNSGTYFLLKARREKIDEEILLTRKKFKDCEINVVPLLSPVLEVERHLVRVQRAREA